MTTDDTELAELLVERKIQKVLLAYCQGVDRRDWTQVRSCYHDGASDSHGAFVGNPDELVEWLKVRHESVLSSMHLLSNITVRRSEDGRLARVESYCISLQEVDTAGGDPFAGEGEGSVFTTVACRYVDTFENVPAVGWRILKREVAFDWMRRTDTADFVELDPAWTLSRRDPTDALYGPWPAGQTRIEA